MQAMGKDQTLEPEYRIVETGQQGEYWLIDRDRTLCYAVPRPKQTYNMGQFKSGGLDRVFECRGVRHSYRYRRLEVIKPASFRNNGTGYLQLVDQGVLRFDDEEQEI
jgi:hypothetical protein